jgi:hypothetical protein
MTEIKSRMKIIEEALSDYKLGGKGTSVPRVELACLQMRKVYELIVFAGLTANVKRYSTIRKRFEKEWNLKEIVRQIKSFNPNFLPIAFKDETPNAEGEMLKMSEKDGLMFTPENIIQSHGRFGNILHAQNPYAAAEDYRVWAKEVTGCANEVVSILSNHIVVVEPDDVIYRVSLAAGPKKSVEVATLVAV